MSKYDQSESPTTRYTTGWARLRPTTSQPPPLLSNSRWASAASTRVYIIILNCLSNALILSYYLRAKTRTSCSRCHRPIQMKTATAKPSYLLARRKRNAREHVLRATMPRSDVNGRVLPKPSAIDAWDWTGSVYAMWVYFVSHVYGSIKLTNNLVTSP